MHTEIVTFVMNFHATSRLTSSSSSLTERFFIVDMQEVLSKKQTVKEPKSEGFRVEILCCLGTLR